MRPLKNEYLPKLNGLSPHIKKAIEKNTNCHDNLVRELKDVEMKRKAALNEIILKREAFIKQQLKWEKRLPVGYKHGALSNPEIKDSQQFQQGGLDSKDSDLFPGRIPKMAKRFSLPTLSRYRKKGPLSDKLEIESVCSVLQSGQQSLRDSRNPSPTWLSCDPVKQVDSEAKEDDCEPIIRKNSDDGIRLQRGRSLAHEPHVLSSEVALRPRLRQRRRTLHNLFQTFNGLDEDSTIVDLAQSSLKQITSSTTGSRDKRLRRRRTVHNLLPSDCMRLRKELEEDEQKSKAVNEGNMGMEPAPKYNRRRSVHCLVINECESPALTEGLDKNIKDTNENELVSRQRQFKRRVSFQGVSPINSPVQMAEF